MATKMTGNANAETLLALKSPCSSIRAYPIGSTGRIGAFKKGGSAIRKGHMFSCALFELEIFRKKDAQLQDLLDKAITRVGRVGSIRNRNNQRSVLQEAETVLHEVFNASLSRGKALLPA